MIMAYPSILAPDCPAGMIYMLCGSTYPQTCKTDENAVCTNECVEGCFCPDGEVLDEDGYCIDPSQCLGKHIYRFQLMMHKTFVYRMSRGNGLQRLWFNLSPILWRH